MTSQASRKLIAALQVSLDGFVQGPDGEQDWADSWASALGLIPDVDMFVLGAGMYPDYGDYWKAILESPDRVPPFQERVPSVNEIAYALGFGDPAYFTRFFSRLAGDSPRAFRRRDSEKAAARI